MAKIRKIYDETIKPDGNKTVIYPITSTRAVYTPTNVTLDNILNEGYRFGGVVSPSSVPTIYDQRVFYGASEPGVYSAFGGIIVETGEAAFLMYDGSIWTKKLFTKTGSNITGFKVVDSISDLPTTPSTLGYLIPDSNSVQTLYVWVGEGGDTYGGMYNNCGRLNGESAYETAVRNGYQGTEEEWLLSLNGQDGRGIVNVSYQQDIETRNTIVTFLFSDGTTSSFPLQDGLSKDQIDANTEAIAAADSNIETLSTATSANTTSIVGLSKLASINVILDPTQSFASQVTEPNVVYEIRDDFDLGGAEITLPDDCVLLFNGGKIANGTVNAANATYQVMGLYQIFDGIEFGNNFFKCCDIIPEYVGAVGDGVADDTEAMRESLKISSLGRTTLVIPSGRGYLVSGPINYYNGGFANSFINIKGFLPDMKTTDTDVNSILNYGRIIVADGACLFGDATRTNLSTLKGAISNVAILGTRNLDTNFFKWCNVVSFCMKYCFVCNFGAFLCDSSLKTNSRVHDNHFASVFYFSRLVNRDLISLIDSAIFNNYINGGANPKEIVTVNACFQFGEYNGSVIRDNFIDFYRTIYEPVRTSNSGPAGHINAFGNHYQVFRYFYFMSSGITSMYMNSQHEYFNWNDEAVIGSPDGPLGNNYMPFVSRTYTGRDGNTYNLPPYIMRTTGGAQSIVIEDITVEQNMDKLIMFHGAPTSYKYNRYKFTVANWTDDFGTKYSLPEGSDEGNYCGGSFQYKEVETNFICTLSELPTLKVGTYSAFPYGAKALYNGTIYKAKRFYTTAAVARWVPYNDVAFFPDYEDFTANSNMQLKLRDRDASNGMGYKILRTDKTFAAQVTSTNTVYEIRYNFDLDSSTVALPENVVLKFVGGKISNGTLNGNKTKIDTGKYDTIFDSVILSGTFDCDYLTPVQFGAVMDSTTSADTNSSIINNYVKPSCEGTSTPLYIPVGSLYFSSPIVLSGNVDITCKGTLVYNGSASTAVALTIGTSQNQYNRNYVIKLSNANDSNNYYSQVSDEWQIQDVTGLLMKNIHSSRIHLEYIKGFPYNVVLSGENAPFAYNTIYCGYNTGYTYINMKLICSGSGYSNENLFIGGRFGITSTCSVRDISKAIVLDGDTNVINNNVFIKPCIEGHNIGFEFRDATRNTILASRNENNTYNNAFLSNSRENVVLSGYYEGTTLNESNGSNLSSSFAALLNSYMATVANDPVIVYGNNSNLIQLLNNRTISGNAARSLYGRGYVIDVSTFKTWRISQDVSSRFAIVPLNVDNSPITVTNVTDFITNTSGWLIQNSYIRSSADAYSRMVTFSSNTSKVFIGTTATTDANRLRLETMYNPYTTVSSLIPFPELAKWPYDVKSVNSIPSTQRNVPTGYSIYYAPSNKFITWDGSSWNNYTTNNFILSPEQSVSSQMTSTDTSYEIRDSFDLEGATINVPAGCKLVFNGGKFSNGTLNLQDTVISSDSFCFNCDVTGTIHNGEVLSDWFCDNRNSFSTAFTRLVALSNSTGKPIIVSAGTYVVDDSVHGTIIKNSISWNNSTLVCNVSNENFVIYVNSSEINEITDQSKIQEVLTAINSSGTSTRKLSSFRNCAVEINSSDYEFQRNYGSSGTLQSPITKKEYFYVDEEGAIQNEFYNSSFANVISLTSMQCDRSIEFKDLRMVINSTYTGTQTSEYRYLGVDFDGCSNLKVKNFSYERVPMHGDSSYNYTYSNIRFRRCYNLEIDDLSSVNTELLDYNSGSSYVIGMNRCINVYAHNIRIGGGDMNFWGDTGANYLTNAIFDNCTLSRIDVHHRANNITVQNSTLYKYGISVSGYGTLLVNGCRFYNCDVVTLRPDYGSYWDGDIMINDCFVYSANSETSCIVGTSYQFKFAATSDIQKRLNAYCGKTVLIKNLIFNGTSTNNAFRIFRTYAGTAAGITDAPDISGVTYPKILVDGLICHGTYSDYDRSQILAITYKDYQRVSGKKLSVSINNYWRDHTGSQTSDGGTLIGFVANNISESSYTNTVDFTLKNANFRVRLSTNLTSFRLENCTVWRFAAGSYTADIYNSKIILASYAPAGTGEINMYNTYLQGGSSTNSSYEVDSTTGKIFSSHNNMKLYMCTLNASLMTALGRDSSYPLYSSDKIVPLAKVTNPPIGTMAIYNSVPIWWTGNKWIHADGSDA